MIVDENKYLGDFQLEGYDNELLEMYVKMNVDLLLFILKMRVDLLFVKGPMILLHGCCPRLKTRELASHILE